MGIFDRFGGAGRQRPTPAEPAGLSADDQAIARYRYMLRTAPPETIEQAHAEAFAKLTPEQRRRVLDQLRDEIPEAERAAVMRGGDSPEQLARVATRAEIRQPGAIERVFGGVGTAPGGRGLGSLLAGSFLASMAGTVLGSMIAQQFFDTHPEGAHGFGDAAHQGDESQSADHDTASLGGDDAGGDISSDFGGGDTFDI